MSKYDGLLESLREARRYVRSNPDEAVRLCREAQRSLDGSTQGTQGHRLLYNLDAGIRFIRCAPDVLKGYIDGAILEIQDHASRENA